MNEYMNIVVVVCRRPSSSVVVCRRPSSSVVVVPQKEVNQHTYAAKLNMFFLLGWLLKLELGSDDSF